MVLTVIRNGVLLIHEAFSQITFFNSGLDMVNVLANIGFDQSVLQSRLATGTGTFVVAYAVHKVFSPVRIAVTLTCTPMIVRVLRNYNILKQPR